MSCFWIFFNCRNKVFFDSQESCATFWSERRWQEDFGWEMHGQQQLFVFLLVTPTTPRTSLSVVFVARNVWPNLTHAPKRWGPPRSQEHHNWKNPARETCSRRVRQFSRPGVFGCAQRQNEVPLLRSCDCADSLWLFRLSNSNFLWTSPPTCDRGRVTGSQLPRGWCRCQCLQTAQ